MGRHGAISRSDRRIQSIGQYDHQRFGGGQVVAKEGADGLLGLGVIHPDYPNGLGIVIKIAHGWNAQATWYVARAVLGVGIDLKILCFYIVRRHFWCQELYQNSISLH